MYLGVCSGLRCKATDDASSADQDQAADERIKCGAIPTSTHTGEQNPANFLMPATNDNLENRLLNPVGSLKASSGRHCKMSITGILTKPKDPFDFHVYVGFSPENNNVIRDIIAKFETEWNLLCCSFRCNSQITDMKKEEGRMQYLIARSEKCLLYLTPDYVREPWSKVEAAAAAKKARCFSGDTLFILKDPQLSAESLKDLDLQEFPATDWPCVGGNARPYQLVLQWLHQSTKLSQISQMPEKISGCYEALVYYFGYLKMVLHDHRQKMKSVVDSWPEDARSGAQVFLPMLIVVPKSCRAPKSFHVEGKLITSQFRDKYVVNAVNRAGSPHRDYKMPVVKLIVDAEKNDVIYFSGEFPAILLTLYETYMSGQAGLDKKRLIEVRTDFYHTLQSLLCHPDNRHCIDQYRLVLWPDDSEELYNFLLPVMRSAAEERDCSSLVVYNHRSSDSQMAKFSSNRLESTNNLCTLTGGSPPYLMRDISPRGICLVISDVTPTSIVDVFEQFDFNVRTYSDQMTADDLDSLLCNVAQEDHSNYDAFVCYIASRGRLGGVCTPDGTCTSAVTLVNIFNHKNCDKLRGKPKVFIMHTTDDETIEDPPVSDNNETQVQFIVHRGLLCDNSTVIITFA